jgi:eukaryotic-like serine/threonine-protein kinase
MIESGGSMHGRGGYERLRTIACGGMARIDLVQRRDGAGGVHYGASKTLYPELTGSIHDASLRQEARVLSWLDHPNIVRLLGAGLGEDGRPFLVTEYVAGKTVEAIVARAREVQHAIPLELALGVALAIADALDHAHERVDRRGNSLGIVHRDISPSNIIVGHDGIPKLIDFGVATFLGHATDSVLGTIKGKLGYLAPEQILGRPLDRRTDVFALGIVLYELTSLVRAFRGATNHATLRKIVHGQLVRPSQLVAGYPRELEAVLLRALASDPADRFQTAGALRGALLEATHQLGLPTHAVAVARALHDLFEPHHDHAWVDRTARVPA